MVLHVWGSALTLARGDSAYRRLLHRGFFALLVCLFSEAVLQIRRRASAMPLCGI